MKKILHTNVLIILPLAILIVGLTYLCIQILGHSMILSAGDQFPNINETHGNYRLQTKECTESSNSAHSHMIYFYITKLSTNKTVFSSRQSFRAYDLKAITFAKNCNDIFVISGDVGVTCYLYQDEKWDHFYRLYKDDGIGERPAFILVDSNTGEEICKYPVENLPQSVYAYLMR